MKEFNIKNLITSKHILDNHSKRQNVLEYMAPRDKDNEQEKTRRPYEKGEFKEMQVEDLLMMRDHQPKANKIRQLHQVSISGIFFRE